MKILGLTGSIGMGKSTAAGVLSRLRVRVHDSDAIVHQLFAKGGKAVPKVAAVFPDAVRDGAVDRTVLGRLVFADPPALKRLEGIVHPLVTEARQEFLRQARRARRKLVVLDVPLLFDGGLDRKCDATIVVSAPSFIQALRVLKRPGMTAARFKAILSRQAPDREKRRRADFLVRTGLGRRESLRSLLKIVRLMERQGTHLHARNRRRHGNHRP